MITPDILVLPVVVALQLGLLVWALRLYVADDAPRLGVLQQLFERDIRARAGRGQPPDWMRYQADMERLFAARDEKMRLLAAAALAVGLGGTMATLLLSLWGQGQASNAGAVVGGVGRALGASLLGIVNNLVIVLYLLPGTEARFIAASDAVRSALQRVADAHQPSELFLDALRAQIESVTVTLNAEFAKAFSAAFTEFPTVAADLREVVGGLQAIVTDQSRSVGTATAAVTQSAQALESSASGFHDSAGQIVAATQRLVDLPQTLATTFEDSRQAFVKVLHDDQAQRLDQIERLLADVERRSGERTHEMAELTGHLVTAVSDVRTAVAGVPESLHSKLAAMVAQLSDRLAHAAHQHTDQLRVASEHMAEAATAVQGMPSAVKAALEAGREEWRQALQADQKQHLEQQDELRRQVEERSHLRESQMQAATLALLDKALELKNAVDGIAAQLAQALQSEAGRLGNEFGRQARDHVNELAQRIEQRHGALLDAVEAHERAMRNNIGTTVKDLLAAMGEDVERTLVAPLNGVAERIAASTEQMPRLAQQLHDAQVAWVAAHEESVNKWRAASDGIHQVATRLVDADGHLKTGVEALEKSAQHLQAVAGATASFEQALLEAVTRASACYVEGLTPLQQTSRSLMNQMHASQAEIDRLLGEQIQFVRSCVETLINRGDGRAPGEQA